MKSNFIFFYFYIKLAEFGAGDELRLGGDFRETLDPTIRQLRQSIKQHNARRLNVDLSGSLVQCIIGYLGTIELSLQSTSELQGIKNCIRFSLIGEDTNTHKTTNKGLVSPKYNGNVKVKMYLSDKNMLI